MQTRDKQKFHMSYYIVKTDFEAFEDHQEREVQTQNVEKAENQMHTLVQNHVK